MSLDDVEDGWNGDRGINRHVLCGKPFHNVRIVADFGIEPEREAEDSRR